MNIKSNRLTVDKNTNNNKKLVLYKILIHLYRK